MCAGFLSIDGHLCLQSVRSWNLPIEHRAVFMHGLPGRKVLPHSNDYLTLVVRRGHVLFRRSEHLCKLLGRLPSTVNRCHKLRQLPREKLLFNYGPYCRHRPVLSGLLLHLGFVGVFPLRDQRAVRNQRAISVFETRLQLHMPTNRLDRQLCRNKHNIHRVRQRGLGWAAWPGSVLPWITRCRQCAPGHRIG